MTNVGEYVEELDPSGTDDGILRCCGHFGKQFESFQNFKHRVSYDPANSLLGIYTCKRSENKCPH